MWEFTGKKRPSFADEPSPGQESVWDYPRPPAVAPCGRLVEVRCGESLLASSTETIRIVETASPPTYYLPMAAIRMDQLTPTGGSSHCEWKGQATYYALAANPSMPVAWGYDKPAWRYRALKGHVCFYPGRVACFVDGERVRPQPGGYYGGWITNEIAGPVKGGPGTGHW